MVLLTKKPSICYFYLIAIVFVNNEPRLASRKLHKSNLWAIQRYILLFRMMQTKWTSPRCSASDTNSLSAQTRAESTPAPHNAFLRGITDLFQYGKVRQSIGRLTSTMGPANSIWHCNCHALIWAANCSAPVWPAHAFGLGTILTLNNLTFHGTACINAR